MTTYVYQVTSDRPLDAFTGIGNVAQVSFTRPGLTVRDQPKTVASNGAATGAGTLTIELIERKESR